MRRPFTIRLDNGLTVHGFYDGAYHLIRDHGGAPGADYLTNLVPYPDSDFFIGLLDEPPPAATGRTERLVLRCATCDDELPTGALFCIACGRKVHS